MMDTKRDEVGGAAASTAGTLLSDTACRLTRGQGGGVCPFGLVTVSFFVEKHRRV